MLKVAICDDSLSICSDMEKMLKDYGKEISQRLSVEIFYSGKDLVKHMEQEGKLDLIFLDIELGDINGIEIGKHIRHEMRNNIVQIVYISCSQDYAMALFKNRPMDFLVKPLSREDIARSIDVAVDLTIEYDNSFEVTIGKNFYRISFKDIIYFEGKDRKIDLVTTKKTYEYYGRISDAMKKVPNNEFLYIHRSFLVNYAYISEIRAEEVTLIDDKVLPISQSLRPSVRKELIRRRQRGK